MTDHQPDRPDGYEDAVSAQKQAALPDISAWVSANAGSGKTKVLIDRVARLLLKGANPDAILCVTYTKAAASEMQKRLFERLGEWSVMADRDLNRDLTALQGRDETDYDAADLGRARTLFARALETPGGLRIETIHAFCGRVLKRFPLEAGVPPGFRELDETESDRLQAEAIDTGLAKGLRDHAYEAAFDRVCAAMGGLGIDEAFNIVLADRSKLARFLHYAPDAHSARTAILKALDAPDKSLADLLDGMTGSGLPLAEIRAAVAKLGGADKPSDMKLEAALRAVLETQDTAKRWDIYSGIFFTGGGDWRKANPYTKAYQGSVVSDLFCMKPSEGEDTGREVSRIQILYEQLLSLTLVERTLDLVALARPIVAEHAVLKQRLGGLDFDDLILKTADLVTRPGLAEWVLYKLDGGLSHVLLDEAQDTSPDQWRILNALTDEFFDGKGASEFLRTRFVVGDKKQSIYSFQGADPERFISERQLFAAMSDRPDIRLPEMEMSFRSVPQVLTYVDAVFAADRFDTATAPFSVNPPDEADITRHTSFRGTHAGCVEIWPITQAEEAGENEVPELPPVDMELPGNVKITLAGEIAAKVEALLAGEDGGICARIDGQETVRTPVAGDILILVPTRNQMFYPVIDALKKAAIPVAGADRFDLLATAAVQDLLNLIRFVLLPEDDLVLAEIIRGPFANLLDDDNHLFPLAYGRGEDSLWSRLQASDVPEHLKLTAFLQGCLRAANRSAYDFLSGVLETLDEDRLTGWEALFARFGPSVRDPVETLMSKALEARGQLGASLQSFLHALEQAGGEVKRELSGDTGQVRVMTVHGAKGLEAPIVILPETTKDPTKGHSKVFPYDEEGTPVWLKTKGDDSQRASALRELEDKRIQAEKRRQLYVALTRAKDRLIICGTFAGRSGEDATGYPDGSWYKYCLEGMAALCPDADFSDTVRFGEPPALPEAARLADGSDSKAAAKPVWLRAPAPRESGKAVLRSPSQLLAGDAPVIPPFGDGYKERFRRGRLIHTLLQVLPGIVPDARRAHANAWLEKTLGGEEADLAASILKDVFGVLDDPVFANVFGPGSRAEVPVVGTGAHLPKGMILNGRVDRLVITPEEFLIVDYKTDRPPPASEDDVASAYLVQMAAYGDVLASAWPDREIKCALIWTDGPHLMTLSESRLREVLAKAGKHL